MATKKETAKDTPTTVAAKSASKVAAEVLKRNPDINEVYVTSDGTAFYTRNDAQNHANSLPNREVFCTRRDAAAKAAAKPAPKAEEENADTDGASPAGETTDNDEPAKTDE